jgi:hypothetical protein
VTSTQATGFINAWSWTAGIVRGILRPRIRELLWKWIERNVVIPEDGGSTVTGPLRTSLFPVYRTLYEMVQQRHVHFFTFAASARAGKTLFSICILLWWIAERHGPAIWLDPTRRTAIKFVRTELEAFLRLCRPVWALAIVSLKTWTTLEKSFRGKFLRVIGSGAESDLHGYHAALVIVNEADRCKQSVERDAASSDKVIARTKHYEHSRLILRNCTPTEEHGEIWTHFLAGSQHYCYLPCPHCEAFQRLTFFPEKKDVPFTPDGTRLPPGELCEEKTGFVRFDQFAAYKERPAPDDPTRMEKVKVGYDKAAVRRGATYCCAYCEKDIEWVDLGAMLDRHQWRAHNPGHDPEHISGHIWAAYSPFESWGAIAAEFIEARGNLGKLIKFTTLTLGLPFIRQSAAIKEDDLERVIRRTPHKYLQGQIPAEAEFLTMTVDVQGSQFFWAIRAWGIMWEHPDRPTWSALVDWGEAVSWQQIEEFAGLTPDAQGKMRKFSFTRPDGKVREYSVTAGLVDSGFEAETNKKVYEFCLKWRTVFSPYKGGDQSKTRGATIRLSPIWDDQMDLVWAWSDFFAAQLYYNCIKDGNNSVGDLIHWWLPLDIDQHYRTQLTSERRVEEHGKMIWKAFGDNHLGDCEKMQEVLRDTVELRLNEIREERAEEEAVTDSA